MNNTPNIILATLDSCRYDSFERADARTLKSYGVFHKAHAPATFTLPSHIAFFSGILPNVIEPMPYYNRFQKQLLSLTGIGETNVAKNARWSFQSDWDIIKALEARGFKTFGCGAMTWFKQKVLTQSFQEFIFTGTNADLQIDLTLDFMERRGDGGFFSFINFGETHAPFSYKGKVDDCTVDVRARVINWPPRESVGTPVGIDCPAFAHQVESIEWIDRRIGRLLSKAPANTIVIICGDHGECFGEDGYWGHGVYHPKVMEVPLGIFSLSGIDL